MKANPAIKIFGLVIAFVLVAPTIIVVATAFTESSIITFPPKGFSFRWFEEVLTSRQWIEALQNSLITGAIAAVLAVVVGISLAMAAARGTAIPRTGLTTFALMPMLVPLVVIAIGVYLAFVQIGFYGNVFALGVAHSILGIPFVFINVLAALTNLDPRVEEAARASGASYPITLLRITVPQILPSAFVGGLFAFIASWDEVVVAIFLVTPGFKTIPVMIWSQVREGLEPSTSAVSTVLTVVTLVVFGIVALLNARKSKRTATS
ncbi:ABC transporter permease [Ruicaihuangia caeni]|uniref:ABC transporter permease n=1 Tax=Ruicaihuangia caeni TaxID=3042517 RepID=A0AAW6T8Z6_9MICO|nr:ABC transporter permease [Klugiella sp. YN-L-19]MDI2097622.1 ABC transporter permease [Klugiella sp. YN-L-19]